MSNALGKKQIMSAQGVKKRLGSRRQVKSKSPELEFHITETAVEQHSVSTEDAEDVPQFSKNRRKLGSSRRNEGLRPGKELRISDEAAENPTEDKPLDTSLVSSTEEVKVTHPGPEESPHRHSELRNPRHEKDQNSTMLAHNESFQDNCLAPESHVIAEDAELRTERQPEQLEVNLPQSGGAVQTFDFAEVSEKELNMKPVEADESQRKGGFDEVREPLSQSNHERKVAESSSTETEETPETTHWFLATGTVEKASELTCKDEIVTSEPPESFLSGSPFEVQNLNINHPEPAPGPSVPIGLAEGLHERGAHSKVELSDDDDDDEEDDGELEKPGLEVEGLGGLETVAKENTEDQRESTEVHDALSKSVSCDAPPDSSPHLQHVPLTETDQSEPSDRRNEASGADEPPNTPLGRDFEADGQMDDVKLSSDQLNQEHKDLPSEIEQNCSSQALPSERDSCWDPPPQESNACFTLNEHRRKLGSRRHKGAVDSESEPPSQSNLEPREAQSSGTETEETTYWFLATGTVEKASELMSEDEIVTSEPPESFLSGSPSEVQNLNTRPPEPEPELSVPKTANIAEDLHERAAHSKVELSDDGDDDDDEAMMLMQQMSEMTSKEGDLSVKTLPEAGFVLDCDLQEVVELLPTSTAMMTTASGESRDHQPAQKINIVVKEGKSFQEDTDLSQNIIDKCKTATTGSASDIWGTTSSNHATPGSVTLECFTLEAPHALQDSLQHNHAQHTNDAKEAAGEPGGEGLVEGQWKPIQSSETLAQEEAQDGSSSPKPTNAKLTSSEPSSPLCFQETISADPAMEVPGEREPGGHLDDQERSKQRKRKMGSTRWNPKNPQVRRAEITESSTSAQAGREGLERPAEEENMETPVKLLQEEAEVTSDPQSTHSNPISHTDVAACDTGRPVSDGEDGGNATIIVEGSHLWDFTAPEAPITSCTVKPSQCSPPPSLQSTQGEQQSLGCRAGKQEQPLQSAQESTILEMVKSEREADGEQKDLHDPDKVAEGGCIKVLGPANTGPDLNNRRRTMASACRSPSSHRKEEALHHQQRMDDKAADQQREDSSLECLTGPVKITHPPGPALLQTSEEAPTASESDHQPTTFPENDMSDTLSSRRRRKLGSHRRSPRPQSQETQTGSDVGSIAEQTAKTDGEDQKSEVRSVFRSRDNLYFFALSHQCDISTACLFSSRLCGGIYFFLGKNEKLEGS